MVNQSRLLRSRSRLLKNKLLEPVKFLKKKRKIWHHHLLWSTKKDYLRMQKVNQSSMTKENQSKLPKNRSN